MQPQTPQQPIKIKTPQAPARIQSTFQATLNAYTWHPPSPPIIKRIEFVSPSTSPKRAPFQEPFPQSPQTPQ